MILDGWTRSLHKERYLLEGVLFIFFSSFLYIRLPRGILFRIFASVTYDLNHYVI